MAGTQRAYELIAQQPGSNPMSSRWVSRWLGLLLAVALIPVVHSEELFYIDGQAHEIPAILSLPNPAPTASKAKPAAVLLLHGTASQKNEVGNLYQRLAQALAEAGIASLRIDFAGTGDSPVDYRHYTLSSASNDARVAIEFLRAHGEIDSTRIAVLGFSQGGLIAQQVALEDSKLAALALWSSVAADGSAAFAGLFDRYYEQAQRDGFATVEFPWRSALEFPHQWFEEVREQTLRSAMEAFDRPLLVVAGAADQVVPPEQSMALMGSATHPYSQGILLAGASHIFNVLDAEQSSPGQDEALLHTTVSWLSTILANTPSSAPQ